jgi:hypothetical protein
VALVALVFGFLEKLLFPIFHHPGCQFNQQVSTRQLHFRWVLPIFLPCRRAVEMTKASQPPGAPSSHISHAHCYGHLHPNPVSRPEADTDAAHGPFLRTTLRVCHMHRNCGARPARRVPGRV